MVSHDRFFISKTATKIWEIIDGEIKEFKGGYTEYVEWKERMAKQKAMELKNQDNGGKNVEKKSEVVTNKAENAPAQTNNKAQGPNNNLSNDRKRELQNLQKQFAKVESQVNQLNGQKAQIEADLGNPAFYSDKNKFQQLERDYAALKQKLAVATKQYEEMFEKIMELEEG